MEKLNHTPAPWYPVNYGGYIEIQSTDYYENDTRLLDEDKCEHAEANGLLCATAPELLEALKECINAMEYGDPKEETTSLAWNRVIFNGRKAVNKALGIKE